jgi:tryptophan-rich sensory protein
MSVEDTLEGALDGAAEFLNAGDRPAHHVALGLAVTVGFALASAALAKGVVEPRRRTRLQAMKGEGPVTERPRGSLGLLIPAVFSATTLSALRVWNAPSRTERTNALSLWAVAQAANAALLAIRPSSRVGQIAAAMTAAGLAAAFAHEARRVDVRAGKLAAPFGSTTRMANRVEDRATVH